MARPRKHNPTIPPHIDQAQIPAGVYWDKSGTGRWYVLERDDDGKPRAKTVAGRTAYLSDLHAIAERAKGLTPGTVDAVLGAFHESTDFKGLAPRTRADYKRYRKIACSRKTKLGVPFGELAVNRLTAPVIQRLVEAVAKEGHPTKANHLQRYLHRSFRWGVNHGKCRHNPAAGVQQVREQRAVTVPAVDRYTVLLQFARERAQRTARTRGSCAPYLPLVMELAYLCRLRGIEAITLTDAHLTDAGIVTNRRKGSRDTLVAWTPRLRAVVDTAIAVRKAAQDRTRCPIPMQPDQRPLIVAENGQPLTKSGFDTAWQRLMKAATDHENGGVLDPSERFGLHAMKHRGITDTPGTLKEKQSAGGHRSEAMTQLYDHELTVVPPPKGAEF